MLVTVALPFVGGYTAPLIEDTLTIDEIEAYLVLIVEAVRDLLIFTVPLKVVFEAPTLNCGVEKLIIGL